MFSSYKLVLACIFGLGMTHWVTPQDTQCYSVQIHPNIIIFEAVNWSDSDSIGVDFHHSIWTKIRSRKFPILANMLVRHIHHHLVTNLKISPLSMTIIVVLLFLLRFLNLISGRLPGCWQSVSYRHQYQLDMQYGKWQCGLTGYPSITAM